MIYRCVKDLFAYCVGGGKAVKGRTPMKYRDGATAYEGSGTCRLKPATCGHYQTQLQLQAELDLAHGYKPPKEKAKAGRGKK